MALETSDIKKLQNNLCTIRKIAGWTAQELGQKIGVTKQTISNLENQKTEMTVTQYIAIRTVLDFEIENNKSNEVLPQVVHILLDLPDDQFSDDDRKNINQAVNTLAAVSAGGMGLVNLAAISSRLLGEFVGLTATGTLVGTISWLQKLMKK